MSVFDDDRSCYAVRPGVEGGGSPRPVVACPDGSETALAAALYYHERGFCVVPQLPGDKHPCVRWKPYQGRRPTEDELYGWFGERWPEAGMAAILGPVSGLVAVDVDGPDAHAALVGRLGGVPAAPTVRSGSGDPRRYHLYYRCPDAPTAAKITPWHPKLEFRGRGGVVVLPPSLHKSGKRYRWAEGASLDELPCPDLPAAVLKAIADHAAKKSAGGRRKRPEFDSHELIDAVGRARAYLAVTPPSVEGEGGDLRMYKAACALVVDFGLPPGRALPLLREYNTRAVPPWPDDELVRKLRLADGLQGERGRLLRPGAAECRPHDAAGPAGERRVAGDRFHGTIPDFVLADWNMVRSAAEAQGRGRPYVSDGLAWLKHYAVISRRSSYVVIPDVIAAQCVWGDRAGWPRNWRARLDSYVYESGKPARRGASPGWCPAACPLHGRAGPRHRHLVGKLPETALGFLHVCRVDDGDADGVFAYDFTYGPTAKASAEARRRNAGAAGRDDEEYDPDLREELHRLRKEGVLCSVYLPALVFGPSPRSGLTRRQALLLTVLVRELTRRSGNGTRADKAEVLTGGRAPDARQTHRVAPCPYLDPGKPYVGFNGNGKRGRDWGRGYGYRLVGKTGGGWMARAGRAVPDDLRGRWKAVRGFLKDLEALSEPFGLVAAGWRSDERQWRSLPQMLAMTRNRAGRKWLNGCVLRIYAPADYLGRWRSQFAERMGFGSIPGGGDETCAAPAPRADAADDAAEALRRWKAREGMTDRQTADRLGVSRSYVSAALRGDKRCSDDFRARLARAMEGGADASAGV